MQSFLIYLKPPRDHGVIKGWGSILLVLVVPWIWDCDSVMWPCLITKRQGDLLGQVSRASHYLAQVDLLGEELILSSASGTSLFHSRTF